MSGVSAVQHVFVVGSKGIPGSYGGYETFVDRLTEYHEGEPGLRYHVACKSLSESGEFSYHNARCFRVRVPQIGPAQAIWYDVAALADCVAIFAATVSRIQSCTCWRAASARSRRISRARSTVWAANCT